MNKLLACFLLCTALPVFGDDAPQFVPGVKVKFGVGDGAGTDYYLPVPLNITAAKSVGWSKKHRPLHGLHHQLALYCAPELSFCGLYDPDTGNIVGSQTALKRSKLANVTLDLKTMGMVKWWVDNSIFWTITQYWVDDAFLKLSPEKRTGYYVPNRLLPLDSIWLTTTHRRIQKIPVQESQVTEGTLWNVQGCMTGMGLHYYYDVNKTECTADNTSPWAVIYDNGTLIATFFATYGAIVQEGTKWLEDGGAKIIKFTFPRAPQCQYDISTQVISQHQWFVDNPQDIICNSTMSR